MRSSYCVGNFFVVEEGFADNTHVLSKSIPKNAEKLTSKNQFGRLLYSPNLTAGGTGLLRGDVTFIGSHKKTAALSRGSPCFF